MIGNGREAVAPTVLSYFICKWMTRPGTETHNSITAYKKKVTCFSFVTLHAFVKKKMSAGLKQIEHEPTLHHEDNI